ncbi:MAG: SulP family inorganic anion transporter [Verrucomicrobiales bacterium]
MSRRSIAARFLPVLQWLPNYERGWLRGDLTAGLTVGVMLIPQGMAYAMLAGLPPIHGLYAVTLPLAIYALLGTSRQLALGPSAMVALLVASGVGTLAPAGAGEFVALAALLALMVGLVQLAMGAFRLGFLVNFLSRPVVSGFTSAAALVIGANQLKHLLGVDLPRSKYLHEILLAASGELASTNPWTLGMGLGAIGLLLIFRRLDRRIPGALIVVLAGTLLAAAVGAEARGIGVVGAVPAGLPSVTLPPISWGDIGLLLPIALTIAFTGFAESISVAKAMQARHRDYRLDYDQELIALGTANLGASLVQAFPVTGGLSRSAVNDQAGARSGVASMVSVTLIVLTLLFLTPLFYFLPRAVLAAVILVAVAGLFNVREPARLWRSERADFYMLIATFLATLVLGIERGILAGVLLSLAALIYRSSRPHFAVLGKLPGIDLYRNVLRFPEAVPPPGAVIIRFDEQLYFANAEYFRDMVELEVGKRGGGIRSVILDASSISSIDSSGVHVLMDLIDQLEARGIALHISGAIGPLRDRLGRHGIVERIGEDRFHPHVVEAVASVNRRGDGCS